MIREATVNDSERIAEIEVESSRFAYKSILSEDYLNNDLSVEKRTPVYNYWISEKKFDLYVFEDPDTGKINGMMGIGMCGDEDKKEAFELHFIYVDPEHLRKGIGFELLEFFENKGREKGCGEFVIWVLEENGIGINFYTKNNYSPDGGEKIFKRWNKREIRYVKSAE